MADIRRVHDALAAEVIMKALVVGDVVAMGEEHHVDADIALDHGRPGAFGLDVAPAVGAPPREGLERVSCGRNSVVGLGVVRGRVSQPRVRRLAPAIPRFAIFDQRRREISFLTVHIPPRGDLE